MRVLGSTFVFVLLLFPQACFSQVTTRLADTGRTLREKHRIDLAIGLLTALTSSNQLAADGATLESNASGVLGGIRYTYYFNDEFGLSLIAGALNAEAKVQTSSGRSTVESAVVMPLLFGVKYQPLWSALGESGRPFASASFGPYVGLASNVSAGETASTESVVETAMGMRFAIGVDLFLGRLFVLGLGAGYHWVGEFEKRIGSETDYSSPEFSLCLGIVFGHGK